MNPHIFAAAAIAAMALPATAADSQNATPPDLNGFWTHGFSLGFDPPPEGGPGPVRDVKTRAQMRAMGQFLVHEADLNNPALMPWVVEALKKSNDAARAGHRIPTLQETCYPSGVPNYWTHPLMMQVVQTRDFVVFMHARDHQVRIVRLNQQHPANLQPSWYGDSVGHFEGDTLVVDTAGLNDRTPVDIFHTPHTAREHVVERIRALPDGKGGRNLEVRFTVDDPGAFTMPWTGIETYRGVGGPNGAHDPVAKDDLLDEEVCAENDVAIGIPEFTIPADNNPKFR